MKQIQKLDNLIKKIIKEELDSRSKGVLDMEVSEDLLKALSTFNNNDKPVDLKALNAKKTPGGYRIMIQAKTPEFKEFKKDFEFAKRNISGDLEDEYRSVAKAIEKADIEGSVDIIKQGRKSGLEEASVNNPEYLYYILNNKTGKISTGWEYQQDAKDQLAYDKENYPSADLKIVHKTKLKVDPNDDKNWDGKLDEEEREFITADGTAATATPAQRAQISKFKAGTTLKYKKQGMTKESEEIEVADTEVLENEVKASDIAGQVSEIVDKLKTMSEGGEDPKKQKLAAKAMKQMESAKAALEALTAHEMMLEEKAQAEEEKEAERHVKGFKKHLTKLVKEPAAVEKIASKMDAKKMAELKKKMKSGELDEEKLARVMLQHSLKEGWIKKK
jgi:hypothetical protein